MINIREKASEATIHSFLNSYIKETDNKIYINKQELELYNLSELKFNTLYLIPLVKQGLEIIVPLKYKSVTGRHLFHFPIYYRTKKADDFLELDYVTLVALISKEIGLHANKKTSNEELMLRTILSNNNIEKFIQGRILDNHILNKFKKSFIESEQSLILGHLLHPTPKSRQGMTDNEQAIYSPELKGRFQLHYFRAHSSIVQENSALAERTTTLIKQELLKDNSVSVGFKEAYCQNDEYSLIPMHPLQAKHLITDKITQEWINEGLLEYLGNQGSYFSPTSSVRTVYNEKSNFMYKFSLNVRITNSLRVNKLKELERGVEVSRLLNTEIGAYLKNEHPDFEIINDPAYITLKSNKDDLGFEVMLRDNPFKNDKEEVTLLAALCQDNPFTKVSHLSNIIHTISEQEGITIKEVCIKWFEKYLNIAVKPIVSLYFKYGIAIEAHQQNSVLGLENGYPRKFYYRDNQGYYYCESVANQLNKILPNISSKSDTFCSDEVADERLGYYLFFNHLFGLINAFGTSGLVEENILLHMLRETLIDLNKINRKPSTLLDNFLRSEYLPCKANLLTRIYDMDELVGSMETQSVYVQVENPLTVQVVVNIETL
ncbi:IucA/IucC family protein [Bacillus cereus]